MNANSLRFPDCVVNASPSHRNPPRQIRRITSRQKRVLELRAVHRFSPDLIQSIEGISPAAQRMRLYRMRRALRLPPDERLGARVGNLHDLDRTI